MRKRSFEHWREAQKVKQGLTELSSIEDLIKLMMDGKRPQSDRKVNPTQLAYIQSDSPLKAYMGPAGSGKTMTGVADVILRALLMPGTKWFIARRDYNDLLDTTMRSATNVLNNLPNGTLLDRQKMAPQKWWIRPITQGPGGKAAEPSEITFMGLSDLVGSYEFTGGFVDEADEVLEAHFMQMQGRLRYKPYPEFPAENHFMGAAFNAPSKAHWLYTACTGLNAAGDRMDEPKITLFRPVQGENLRNLPKGYYEKMAATMSVELRQRYVEGSWGNTFPGEPVIRQFKRNLHVREGLRFQGGTLFRFWDFGYNRPAVLFVQIRTDGRLQVLREFLGHHIEGTKFIEMVNGITSQHFPNVERLVDYGDPAVAQHKDTGSMLALLNQAGILMRYQRTPFDISLQLLRKRFETLIEGEPAILIDESCTILVDGLAGGYHLKEDGVTPRKDGQYDHEIDALRYGIFNLFGLALSSVKPENLPRNLAFRRTART